MLTLKVMYQVACDDREAVRATRDAIVAARHVAAPRCYPTTASLALAPLAAAGVSFKELGFPDLPQESPAHLSETVSHAPYLHGLTPIALYAAAAAIIRRNRKKEEQRLQGHGKETP